MTLPPGLAAVKTNRPLFADYILGLIAACWGVQGFIWPSVGLHQEPSYRWLTVNPYWMYALAALIGCLQVGATVVLNATWRRIGALLGASLFLNFSINIFMSSREAHGAGVDFGVGLGDIFLFVWPHL